MVCLESPVRDVLYICANRRTTKGLCFGDGRMLGVAIVLLGLFWVALLMAAVELSREIEDYSLDDEDDI